MKKFLLIFMFMFFVSIQSYALCPIDADGESVCSLSDFSNNQKPIFQTQNSGIDINNTHGSIKPIQSENGLNNKLPSSSDSIMKYNSGCQFGICVQDLNNTKNKNQ